MSFIYNLTDTWNDGGTQFSAVKMNVTDTASAAGSTLLDLRVGGARKFTVDKNGTMSVYNTWTDDSNYERLMIDWTSTSNELTFSIDKAGTGTFRNINFLALSANLSFLSSIVLWGYNSPGSIYMRADGNALNGLKLANNWGFFWGAGDASTFTSDTCLRRAAANVVQFSDGTPVGGGSVGWFQWGGQSRVKDSDFSITNITTLVDVGGNTPSPDIPSLTATVAAGRTYSFEAHLFVTCGAGGVKAAIGGTCTATNIVYDGSVTDISISPDVQVTRGYAQATALATEVASAILTGPSGRIDIYGTITVNAAGTLKVQFAQRTLSATASIVKRGSYFIVHDMP
jgi:hypothetical protein